MEAILGKEDIDIELEDFPTGTTSGNVGGSGMGVLSMVDDESDPVTKTEQRTKAKRKRVNTYEDYEKLRFVMLYKESRIPLRQFCKEYDLPKSSLHDWSKLAAEGNLNEDTCTGKIRNTKKVKQRSVIDYIPESDAQDGVMYETAEHIRNNLREDRELSNFDRVALHSHTLAKSWADHHYVLSHGITLDSRLKEFAVCLTAMLTRSDYLFRTHCSQFLKTGGTLDQLNEMKKLREDKNYTFARTSAFNQVEKDVMEFVRYASRDLRPPRTIMSRLRMNLREKHIVELAGIVVHFISVARFVSVFDIKPNN